MSYADVFGGQGSPQWVTLATGVGGKSQPVPARSMSGYRFRNMSGCVVQLVVDGTLQDEFEPYSEGSGYLGYPGQSIQQVQYLVQGGDPVELSNYAVASWRCLVELVPVDLPYQRVRMAATITGTVQLAPGSTVGVSGGTVNVGNSPTVGLTGGTSVGVTGTVPVTNPAGQQLETKNPLIDLGFITKTGPFSTLTQIGTFPIDPAYSALYFVTDFAATELKVVGNVSNYTYLDQATQFLVSVIAPIQTARDTLITVYALAAGATGSHNVGCTAILGPIITIPLTVGNQPLFVQPAGAASTILTAVTSGVAFTRLSLGAAIARPASVYAIAWGASASMTTGTAGTQGWGSIIFLGVKGVTSGAEVWLAACGLQIPAANVGVAANEVAAAGGFNVLPYPLPIASLLPIDAQVQPQLAYVALSGVVPTGAFALID